MENKVINEIQKLKSEIYPRPEWVTLSRDILLQQINPKQEYQKAAIGLVGYWSIFNQAFRQRMFEPALMMLLILGSFIVSSLTINAAFYSLPGDNLYKVKLALERTHVALVPDEESKAELKMEFAQKRVAEFDKIVAQSDVSSEAKKKKIEEVVKEFKNNVTEVNDHLSKINQNVSDVDKDVTVKMALTITEKTEELVKNIDKTTGNLEEADKKDLEEILAQAVQSVQDVGLAAQQLIDDASSIQPDSANVVDQTGEVQGAAVEEEAPVVDEAATETNSNTTDQATGETGDNQAEDEVVPLDQAGN